MKFYSLFRKELKEMLSLQTIITMIVTVVVLVMAGQAMSGAREHVRRFHELFFTIAPDKDAIEKNMERAFVLCDKSAFNYYKDLAEKGYYNRAISGNVNQRIEVDSIHCNFNTYPYAVTTYAREFIVRQSNVTERSLVTTCTLQNSVRSDNNPQGFLMENFLVKENRDIQTYKR